MQPLKVNQPFLEGNTRTSRRAKEEPASIKHSVALKSGLLEQTEEPNGLLLICCFCMLFCSQVTSSLYMSLVSY